MLVIIEGCDGVGKSQLAEAVFDEVKRRRRGREAVLVHHGPPTHDVLEEYATDYENDDRDIVGDRWHLGTLVYAQLYRDTGPYGELGVGGFRWVEKFLQARGACVFIADQPYDVVKRRLETRGEDYLEANHVEWVLDRFREVRDLSVLSDFVSVPDGHPELTPEFAQRIVDIGERSERHAEKLKAFPSYVGGPYTDVLLVGEKRGGTPPFASQAAFMPLKNKSGEYLWEALPDPFWRAVGVANAYEDDIEKLWKELDEPLVVALGRKASDRLLDFDIPHGGVPHPQHVKRFYNKRQAEYGELVAEVAYSQEAQFSWPR